MGIQLNMKMPIDCICGMLPCYVVHAMTLETHECDRSIRTMADYTAVRPGTYHHKTGVTPRALRRCDYHGVSTFAYHSRIWNN
jgi:hypothetical protein